MTDFEKSVKKELQSCTNIQVLNERLNYIQCAVNYCAKFGLVKFRKKYPSLNYRVSELLYYLEELRKRIHYLSYLETLEEKKYRDLGLI